ncbi:putative gustatory receptor 28b [Anopheles aquasalis]|uniref:putative gustatory receptor 28b n=1 Tax=Anopheles aquasalis TaxID=42839 RepID=UPI00215A4290|nr:putative gustatory receptor 28b [Anopheles aquasalis]
MSYDFAAKLLFAYALHAAQAKRMILNSTVITPQAYLIRNWQEIFHQHELITLTLKSVIKMVGIPIVCSILFHFTIIISEVFYTYTSFVQDLRNGEEIILSKYFSCLLFALFEAIQFYYIVAACADVTEQAEKTGTLLNEFLQTDIGSSVERSIELFSIELLHQDFKINNLGLYNIDFTLMFAMIATNTSYLIMLVQFQLAEN